MSGILDAITSIMSPPATSTGDDLDALVRALHVVNYAAATDETLRDAEEAIISALPQVEEVPAEPGTEFDPRTHNAVSTVDAKGRRTGIIHDRARRGFRASHGHIICYPLVVVTV